MDPRPTRVAATLPPTNEWPETSLSEGQHLLKVAGMRRWEGGNTAAQGMVIEGFCRAFDGEDWELGRTFFRGMQHRNTSPGFKIAPY